MKYRVEYFQPKEFLCPCCGEGLISALLAYELDIFRRTWGHPVHINSGWRCPKHNVEVGGVASSRHLLGCAADIAPINPAMIGPFQTLAGYMFGRREGWELKMYPRFVHVAVPRDEASHVWKGGLVVITARAA